ncbi:hypothetical protein ElyMa_007036800 [Elysia marginata]|uniref:Uncharacterized protein n=1 Tax=Elysia marginata TaxID=1093978 RepID=A0AAV4JUX8_9GAST|nr:hypothetical protein ElyMa_007036800 [Elysia marginata]
MTWASREGLPGTSISFQQIQLSSEKNKFTLMFPLRKAPNWHVIIFLKAEICHFHGNLVQNRLECEMLQLHLAESAGGVLRSASRMMMVMMVMIHDIDDNDDDDDDDDDGDEDDDDDDS